MVADAIVDHIKLCNWKRTLHISSYMAEIVRLSAPAGHAARNTQRPEAARVASGRSPTTGHPTVDSRVFPVIKGLAGGNHADGRPEGPSLTRS